MEDKDIEEILHSFFEKIEANKKPVLIGIGVIVVCTLLFIYWGSWAKKNNQKALNAIYQLQVQEEKTTKDAVGKLNENDLSLLVEAYKKEINTFGKAKSGRVMNYYLATLLTRHEKYSQALPYFETYLKHFPLKSAYRALVLFQMAHCAEQSKDLQKAREYLSLADSIDANPQKEFILYRLGRVSEKMGEAQKANAYYEALIKEFPQSPLVARAYDRKFSLSKVANKDK